MTNLGESVGITIKLNPQGLNQFVISQCFITRQWNQILYACEFKLGRAPTIGANYHLRYGLHELNNNVPIALSSPPELRPYLPWST